MNTNKESGQLKSVKSVFKGAVRNTTVLVVSTALVTYPLDFPYVNAYFTDKIVYSEDGRVSGMRTFTTMNNGVVELYFDVHTFNDLKVDFSVHFVDDVLIAKMSLPDDCGFNAEDIIVDSLELTYDDNTLDIKPMVKTSGKYLELIYDWSKIASLIDIDDNTPAFYLSGKGRGLGKSGLGEKFIFKGFGRTPDLQQEFYEQMKDLFFVEGPNSLIVLASEEGPQVYSYTFYLNGKEIPADEIELELLSEIKGVRVEAGKLIVESGADAGFISIRATLKSNRHFKYEFDVELIKEEIQEIVEEVPEEIPAVDEIEGQQPDEDQGLEPEDQDKEDMNLPSDSDSKDDEDDAGEEDSEGGSDDQADSIDPGEDDSSHDADEEQGEDEDLENEEEDEGNNADNENEAGDENDDSTDDNIDHVDEPEDENIEDEEPTEESGEDEVTDDNTDDNDVDEIEDETEEATEENEEAEDENSDGIEEGAEIGETDTASEDNNETETAENENSASEIGGDDTAELTNENGDKESVKNSSDIDDVRNEVKLEKQDTRHTEADNDKKHSIQINIIYADE